MKSILPFLLLILFQFHFNNEKENAQQFLNALKPFEGKQFEGKVIFPEGDKDPFAGKRLIAYFQKCGQDSVRIPFWVGEDKSRTWILSLDNNGLLLKHDHRHEDGSPDEITMYGGYAKEGGSVLSQQFPADEYTAKLIPRAATNEWQMMLNDDKTIFSYMLRRNGELVFRADFDLTK